MLKNELIATENRLVVVGVGKMGESGEKVQTSSYKKRLGDFMYSMVAVVNTVLYI